MAERHASAAPAPKASAPALLRTELEYLDELITEQEQRLQKARDLEQTMQGIPLPAVEAAHKHLLDLVGRRAKLLLPTSAEAEAEKPARKPYKFDDVKKAQYLECLRQGMRRGKASRAVGVTRMTVWSAEQADHEFAAACERAEADACEAIEDALWNKARGGDTTSMIFYLTNRAKERWQDRRNLTVKSAPVVEELVAQKAKELAERLSLAYGRTVTVDEVLSRYRTAKAEVDATRTN
jgi:hypothetical protein